jgi:hypothetical protein
MKTTAGAHAAGEMAADAQNGPLMPEDRLFKAPNDRVRVVADFDELVSTRFDGRVNALCWPRMLEGDFDAVACALAVPRGITHLDEEMLRALELDAAGKRAVEVMVADLKLLEAHGLQPSLDCVNGYTHDDAADLLRTDVCSFHVDSATAEADTFLCTYSGACSLGVMNEHATRHVEVPETRQRLLAANGGADDESFEEFLSDQFFDLHYAVSPDAPVYSFGVGHLWRIATLHPGCAVPPCVHRAPDPLPGQKRLLLIS